MYFSLKSQPAQKIILFLCLATLCTFFYLHWDKARILFFQLDWYEALAIFFSIAMQIGLRTWCERLHYNSIGYKVPAGFLYGIICKQNILNYLPMKFGTVYTAAILKSRYNILLSHFAAVYSVQNLLTLTVTLLVSSFALPISNPKISAINISSIVLVLSSLLIFGILFLFIPFFNKLPKIIKVNVALINSGVCTYRKDPWLLMATLLLRFIAVLIMAWRFQILFALAGEPVTFSISLVLCASILISLLVSVTPAGLGIREGLLAGTSELLMLSSAVAVIVSVMERILVFTFFALVVFIEHIYKQLNLK